MGPMYSSRLSSKGELVIPRAIRNRFGLKPGDRIDFLFDADGEVRLIPAQRSVRRLSGILYDPRRPSVSLEEMQDAIEGGACGEGD